MKKIRILQVIPDMELAGAETMCENLTNELAKNNEVAIISFFKKHTDITKRLEKKGVKIIYLDKKKGPDIRIIKKIKNVINDFKPDVIHTHRYCLEYTYPAVKLSKYKNIKIIHTVHNVASKEIPKFRRILRKLFMRKKNIVYVAISKIIQETIHEEYNIEYRDIPIILNGIDLEKCIIKSNYNNTKLLLNIGRLSEQKNQNFLINVFEKVHEKYPEYKLKIIGNGPLENEIKQKISEKNLDDFVIMEKNKSDCYKDLNESDIFVMTSKWEGIPMTIIEAMGTGLPIISSNVGGIPNMIENNIEGILLDLDESAFVNKICDVIEMKKTREVLGKNALQKSADFSSKIMADKYMKIYEGD